MGTTVQSVSYSECPRKGWCLQVAVREREWNQRLSGKMDVLTWFGVNAAVTVRERVENTGSGVRGGVPSAPSSVKALRCAPTAGAAR